MIDVEELPVVFIPATKHKLGVCGIVEGIEFRFTAACNSQRAALEKQCRDAAQKVLDAADEAIVSPGVVVGRLTAGEVKRALQQLAGAAR